MTEVIDGLGRQRPLAGTGDAAGCRQQIRQALLADRKVAALFTGSETEARETPASQPAASEQSLGHASLRVFAATCLAGAPSFLPRCLAVVSPGPTAEFLAMSMYFYAADCMRAAAIGHRLVILRHPLSPFRVTTTLVKRSKVQH